jgi:hypothetical protein
LKSGRWGSPLGSPLVQEKNREGKKKLVTKYNNNITQLRRSVKLTIFLYTPVPHPIITILHMACRIEFCRTIRYSSLKPIKRRRNGSRSYRRFTASFHTLKLRRHTHHFTTSVRAIPLQPPRQNSQKEEASHSKSHQYRQDRLSVFIQLRHCYRSRKQSRATTIS